MNVFMRLLGVLCVVPSVVGNGFAQSPAETERASERVQRSLERGAYWDAEQDARQLSARITAEYGPDSLEFARASDLLVQALIRNGHAGAASTLAFAEHTVRLKEQHVGRQHLETATSLHNLAGVHVERGQFATAFPLDERGLSIRLRQLQPNDPAVADSLDQVARPLMQMERFEEAKQMLARSQAIREIRSDSEPLALARTLELVAWLNRYSGDYGAAQASVNRALAIRRRLSPDHPDMASTIEVRGDLLWLQGEIEQARSAWTEGLTLVESTLRSEHPAIAAFQRRLALAADVLGYRADARRLLKRGLQVAERSLAPCNPDAMGLREYLASSVTYDGEYVEAHKLYQESLLAFEKCLGAGDSRTATVAYNQAVLATRMGDFAEAERLHRRAIRIWSAGLGPNHPYVARGLDALAETVASREQLFRARGLYERALGIRRSSLGANHPAVAWTLTNLARTTAASGNRPLAARYVAQAIQIYQRAGAADEPDHFARVLALRGELERSRGDYYSARGSFAEALSTRERIFGKTHPLAAESRAELASAELALGSYDAAFSAALEAEQAGRDHLQFTVRYLPERQAMAYAAKRPRGLDLALSIVSAGQVEKAAAVFDAVIRSRGVILDELAARAQSAARADPDVASLNAAMIAARERFANLMLRSLQEGGSVSSALLAEARQQKEEAERALAEQSAGLRAELSRSKIGFDEVRRALPQRSALVSFVRYDRTLSPVRNSATTSSFLTTPSYVAFVTRSDSEAITVVPLGSAATLENLVTTWREEAGGRAGVRLTPYQSEQAYRNAGERLRRRLWDPVAEQVHDVPRVFVVPDGALNLVSFAALPVEGSRYLVEGSSVIHYISTERDLIPADEVSAARGLLAVGGAAFGGQPPRVPSNASTAGTSGASKPPASTPSRLSRSVDQRADCPDFGSVRFGALPGTRDEALEIAGMWPQSGGDDVAVLTGEAADERSVKKAIVGREIVHLATHGFFLGSRCGSGPGGTRGVGGLAVNSSRTANTMEENPLMLAGLALAGANRRGTAAPGQDDGILTAEEVTGLNLQATQWAVLSACDTGLGEVKAGEGVFGLRRAFQIAGARTVIMSLWQVEDQAARQWMRALYLGRLEKHLDTADAMREASLSVLRDRRAKGQTTHPFYWAGFVAAGDWR